jgi:hypothetical protein
MTPPPFQPPEGGEGAVPPALAPDDAGGLLERLVGQLDQRDARLMEVLRGEMAASIETRMKDRGGPAEGVRNQALALALRLAAEEAGAHDVEIVDRLVDRHGVVVDEAGAVTGIREAVERLKSAKPFLFGRRRPTGGTAKAPKPGEVRTRSARDLTPAEWQAEKRRLGVRG